ncbi:MAG: DNA alkylation repair protein, partial [Candidatus Aenigmarchaeota archaeon]|nr:DNA alkylation repair protein [Candidatus Aenigmarchaeota archaeon]
EARLFKEGRKVYGVRTPVTRKIARKYWKHLPANDAKRPYIKEKNEIFKISEQLLLSGYHEPLTIAFQWALDVKNQYSEEDFAVFEKWLKKYVNNWASCDDLCCGAFGIFLYKYPKFLPNVFAWTKSRNRWMKRAAVVSLIYSLRRGKYLKQAFKTADALLTDKDDLVQKGYGWMLKEASRNYQKEVFNHVMKNKQMTPRTALRYAVEKMPRSMQRKAMK